MGEHLLIPLNLIKKPKQSTVNIIIDLRHIYDIASSSSKNFTYGKDWDIEISTSNNFTLSAWQDFFEDNVVSLPEAFSNNSDKTDSHKFVLFAYSDIQLMLYIRILNVQFSGASSLFFQTTSLNIETPYRAIMGQNKIFPFVLQSTSTVNLPLNLPPMVGTQQAYPLSIISYTPVNSTSYLKQTNLTESTSYTYYVNNERYWKNMQQLAIPYIPYFSNCQSYGQFIYLHEIIENSELCKLYAPQNTSAVQQFGFQQSPISDTCESLTFQCIMDEAFYSSNALPKLYQQPMLTNLFFITSDPVDITDVTVNGSTFKATDLIPVVSTNQVPDNYLPAHIEFTISYYQVDEHTKKIIKCEMGFASLIESKTLSSQTNFTVNLVFSFHSMNHAELAIAFALKYPLYLFLSCMIGILSIVMIFIYYLFFRLSNFMTRRIILTQSKYFFFNPQTVLVMFKELWYHLTLYPPIIKGIAIAFIPNILLLAVISITMLGTFWGYTVIGCTSLTDDYICENSLFEIIFEEKITQQTRRGRLGISLVIAGFYICVRMSNIFIPNTKEQRIREEIEQFTNKNPNMKFNILSVLNFLSDKTKYLNTESYDGNVWRDKVWTRALYIFITIIVLTVMVLILYLSFSVYYATNIWMFMFILKLNQICIEEGLKVYIENEVLLGSLSCVMTMTNSVSGLGATDFFAYQINVFVALGIQCFEKVSQVLIVKDVSKQMFKGVGTLQKWIGKQFSNDTEDIENDKDDDDKEDEPNEIGSRIGQRKGDEKDNSEVILTENYEESFGTMEDGDTETAEIKKGNYEKQNSNQDIELFTPVKQVVSKVIDSLGEKTFNSIEMNHELHGKIEKQQQVQQQQQNADEEGDEFEETFQQIFDRKYMKNYKKKEKQEEKIVQEKNLQKNKRNRQLKIYTDFAYKSLNILELPVQTFALWMFYDANQTFVKWNISKDGLVFYFLFSLSTIPFQMIVDMLFLKTVEQLHQVCIKEYVQLVRDRYKTRKLNWKADDDSDVLSCLEPEFKYIDAWCYSSQFYFCYCIFIAGCICIIEGVVTIINNGFNFLGEEKFFLMFILWIPFCYLIEISMFYFYNKTSLWKIKPKVEKNPPQKEGNDQSETNQVVSSMINNSKQFPFKRPEKTEIDLSPFNFKEPYSPLTTTKLMLNQELTKSKFQHMASVAVNGFTGGLILSRDNLLRSEDQIMMQQPTTVPLGQAQFFSSRQSMFVNQYTRADFTLKNSMRYAPTLQRFKTLMASQIEDEEQYYEEFFKETSELLKESYYLKSFLDNQIEYVSDYDISVQKFILQNLSPNKVQSLTLDERAEINLSKQKVQYDLQTKKKEWDSYKLNFKKAQKYKELRLKLVEKKIHFLENEYKDEKFLRKFLKANKVWLRKNINIMFDELLKGASIVQLPLLRNKILNQFNDIYGEYKDNKENQIQLQQIDQKQMSKQEAQKYIGNYLHWILRYWRQRSAILSIAEKCVGGFLLKGIKQSCDYCKRSWGLQLQTQENIEDLFNIFYKQECKRLNFHFNVITLFEKDQVIIDVKRGRGKNRQNTSQSQRYLRLFENLSNDEGTLGSENLISENSKDYSLLDEYHQSEYGEDSYQQTSTFQDFEQPKKKRNSKLTQFFVEHNNQRRDKASNLINKKKFIERWQEFYFQHATFITLCYQCNDESQYEFLEKVQEEKRIREEKAKQTFMFQKQQNILFSNPQLTGDNENETEEDLRKEDNSVTNIQKKKQDQRKGTKGIQNDDEDYNDIVNEVKEDEEEDEDFYASTFRPKSISNRFQTTSIFKRREKTFTKFDNYAPSKQSFQSVRDIQIKSSGKEFNQEQKQLEIQESESISINQDIKENELEQAAYNYQNEQLPPIQQPAENDNLNSEDNNSLLKFKNLRKKQREMDKGLFDGQILSSKIISSPDKSRSSSKSSSSSDSDDSNEENENNKMKYLNQKSFHIKSYKSFKSQESKTHPLTQEQIQHQSSNNIYLDPSYKSQNMQSDFATFQASDLNKKNSKQLMQNMISSPRDSEALQLNTFIESPQNSNQPDMMGDEKKFIFNFLQQQNNSSILHKTENVYTDEAFFVSPRNDGKDNPLIKVFKFPPNPNQ